MFVFEKYQFCRFAIVININISKVYLLWCGCWLPWITSLMWILIVIVAFVIDIVVLETVFLSVYEYLERNYIRVNVFKAKELFLNVLISFQVFQKPYIFYLRKILSEAERQRNYLHKKMGSYGLRPYLSHLYKPMFGQRFTVSFS